MSGNDCQIRCPWAQTLVHVLWWVLHALALWCALALPTDLRIGRDAVFHRCLWAAAMALNVAAYYTLRRSDPGYAPVAPKPAGPAAATPACLVAPVPVASAEEDSLALALASIGVAGAGEGAGAGLGAAPGAGRPLLDAEGAEPPCAACCARRAPGTVHCRECRRCVEQFDHHCAWVGNCVGGRNHHLFARYVAAQAAVAALGFHYTLTALGRSWRPVRGPEVFLPFIPLMALLVLVILLLGLCCTHTVLVLAGTTGRQVMARFRSRGRGGRGRHAAAASGAPALTPGRVLQNGAYLLCGVRPAWLVQGPMMRRLDPWIARAVKNEYYECC